MAKGKRRRKKINIWGLVFASLIVVLGITIVLVVKNIISLQVEKKELKQQEQELQEKRDELAQELQNVDDLEYIEEQARKLLRMIKPGEVLYVLNGTDPRPDQGGDEELVIPDPVQKPEDETATEGDGITYEGYSADDYNYDESVTYDDGSTYDDSNYEGDYSGDYYYDGDYSEDYTYEGDYSEDYTYEGDYSEDYNADYDTGYTEEWEG